MNVLSLVFQVCPPALVMVTFGVTYIATVIRIRAAIITKDLTGAEPAPQLVVMLCNILRSLLPMLPQRHQLTQNF